MVEPGVWWLLGWFLVHCWVLRLFGFMDLVLASGSHNVGHVLCGECVVVVRGVGVVVWELHSGREHLIFVLWCFVVFVSVLGRMVDALAIGADEGRGNLR